MTNLPKKITPCPIVEVILEIRFRTEVPEDAVFGLLYNSVKKDFSDFESLPILGIPAKIRMQDESLRYSAHYRAKKDNFLLQISPRAITISNVEGYVGWASFFEKITEIYNQIMETGIIQDIERVGLRYINVFKDINVFEKSNIIVSLKNENIIERTEVTTHIPSKHGICILKMISRSEIQFGDNSEKTFGSVVDIDAVVDHEHFKDDVMKSINYAHDIEKKLFYTILSDTYLDTLKAEYE